MANKTLFSKNVKSTTVKLTVNEAGGKAIAYSDKHALAQLACTGTFNGTFYANESDQLAKVKELVNKLKGDPKFIAQIAIYARQSGYMKDMPAYLVAVLATLNQPELFKKTFEQVIDNVKMLRNFVQIGRSGEAGKVINMSSGAVRKAIGNWFLGRSAEAIFRGSIGNDPSLKDVLRMARPKPENQTKASLYAYLRESPIENGNFVTRDKDGKVMYSNPISELPQLVKDFEVFKKTKKGEIPQVDFRMLDSILTADQLKELWNKQVNGSWQLVRMNLNNFQKYGVFNDSANVKTVVSKLTNEEEIAKAKAFPYQLLVAYLNTTDVPFEVKEALQDAMEKSVDNVPKFEGKGYVCVDTSGSMGSAVTGNRGTVSSKVRCVDVAGLFAASVLRNNKSVEVLPFDTRVHNVTLNGRDSVMTNAKLLARNGGGTDCSCALKHINAKNGKGDYVIFISDNESWVDRGYRSTGMMTEWEIFKKRNPKAKLICIDMQPYTTSQVTSREDILQIGGSNCL